jgi:hypothetical protein
MMAFNLGERVSFDSQYGRQFGTAVKYNRKTVAVLGDEGRQCRVSPGLLSPVIRGRHQCEPTPTGGAASAWLGYRIDAIAVTNYSE